MQIFTHTEYKYSEISLMAQKCFVPGLELPDNLFVENLKFFSWLSWNGIYGSENGKFHILLGIFLTDIERSSYFMSGYWEPFPLPISEIGIFSLNVADKALLFQKALNFNFSDVDEDHQFTLLNWPQTIHLFDEHTDWTVLHDRNSEITIAAFKDPQMKHKFDELFKKYAAPKSEVKDSFEFAYPKYPKSLNGIYM